MSRICGILANNIFEMIYVKIEDLQVTPLL